MDFAMNGGGYSKTCPLVPPSTSFRCLEGRTGAEILAFRCWTSVLLREVSVVILGSTSLKRGRNQVKDIVGIRVDGVLYRTRSYENLEALEMFLDGKANLMNVRLDLWRQLSMHSGRTDLAYGERETK